MNEINLRVKELRDALELNQEQFGNAIGLSKSGISSIESGSRNVTDKHIKLLVMSFNVNEVWLRYGTGELFDKLSRDEELAINIGKIMANESEFAKNAFLALSRLTPTEWDLIEDLIDNIFIKKTSSQ
jgi:transcriptional regulator with XRE-family HTH domain